MKGINLRRHFSFVTGVCGVFVGYYCSGHLDRIESEIFSYFDSKKEDDALKAVTFEDKLSIFGRFGLPGSENIIVKENYVLSYSNRLRQPNWVLERLSKDTIEGTKKLDRNLCKFKVDPNINVMFTSTNNDYKHSGYQRGHLAAAGNHKDSQNLMCLTFFLSNISPQVGAGFNQSVWLDLENFIRREVRKYKESYVITGPLFMTQLDENGNKYIKYQVIGENNVAVPTHFYKIFLGITKNDSYEFISFVIPNKSLPKESDIKDFIFPLKDIEKMAGIEIFNKIKRKALKQMKNPTLKANKTNL